MNRPDHAASAAQEASLIPEEGWHCRHFYYQFDRTAIAQWTSEQRIDAVRQFETCWDADKGDGPQRLQLFSVAGHKADFGVMTLDPDPMKVDGLHQELLSSAFGSAIRSVYSYVSLTEVSEYVPSLEQYANRLLEEGEREGSESFQAKVNAYKVREPMMREQRLHPKFPPWPVMCFYPMSKKREVGENWFSLPFDQRNRLMAEHARSGMEFAGKVTQLISVSVGLDDWEWGVTLWARNPQFLKEIVYRMRFDEASARYAEFGPFYTGFIGSAREILNRAGVIDSD